MRQSCPRSSFSNAFIISYYSGSCFLEWEYFFPTSLKCSPYFDIIEEVFFMNENFNLTRDKILTKKFTPNVKGYSPDEVDDFLDLIIADYAAFDRYMKESKSYIEELELGMNKLKAQNHQLDIENGQMKTRLSGIKDTDQVTSSNIDLIQRINALEKVLYKNGIDPSKIK